MKKLLSIVFLFVFFLFSCAPIAALNATATSAVTLSSTATPIPTPTVIPPTERPQAVIQQETSLYSGPGNVNFDTVATLRTDQIVYPLGTYVDFVKVNASIGENEVNGFIYKNALASLPSNLPELNADDIPLIPYYVPSCVVGKYDRATDTLTITNIGDGYYDTETRGLKLDLPLRVKIQRLSTTDSSYGLIKILGIPDVSDPWWKGVPRLNIAYNNGYYQIGVYDGTSPNYNASWDLPVSTSEPIQIVFDQANGGSFTVLDKNDIALKHVDLTEQGGLNLPNGLFPRGYVIIGLSASAHSSTIITGLSAGVLPDGKWVNQSDWWPGMAELARKYNLTIGTGISNNDLGMIDWWCPMFKHQFDLVDLNEQSWKGIWLGPGQYDFSYLDADIDWAAQNGWRIRVSNLFSWDAIPDWLLNSKFTRDEYTQILEQHVKTLVGRYKGKVQEWVVVNEETSRYISQSADFWNR